MSGAVLELLLDPVRGLAWLWTTYVVGLHATLFLAGIGLLSLAARGAGAEARARLWAFGVLGLSAVTVLCYLPVGWGAAVVPAGAAAPMLSLGALETAAGDGAGLAWVPALRIAWTAGVALVLARLCWGWVVMDAVARRARPVWGAAWQRSLADARRELGVRRHVELRRSADVPAPLTCGAFRPVVLLPAAADGWDDDERRAVLLHEVAHVRRLDCLVQLLAQVACAWYWFHPGAWWAAARLRDAREHACDARVLRAGVLPSRYAGLLLRLSDGARLREAVGSCAIAVALARPTGLRGRLHAVLGARRPRGLSRPAAAAVAAACAALLLALGSLRMTPRPAVLWRAMESREWSQRAYAGRLLAHHADAATAARLRARAASDPDPRVRAALDGALAATAR
ncbi:MAG TPA: M56 family metallopeptidase [Longimicrobium sp.]|nr:M56 family metallopeptidase [Longimicrobium sp.]